MGLGSRGGLAIVGQRSLLMIAAVVETLTGLAFLISPSAASAFLFGSDPNDIGQMIGRVAGVALLALGISCWGASRDPGGRARATMVGAITLYNAGGGVLIALFAATGHASSPVAWVVAALHLALAAGFVAAALAAGTRRRAAGGGPPPA
jgi:hypothetical protein